MLPSISQRCRLLGPQYDSILFAFHSYGTCSCPACTHPIVLRNGTKILLCFGFITIAAFTVLDTPSSPCYSRSIGYLARLETTPMTFVSQRNQDKFLTPPDPGSTSACAHASVRCRSRRGLSAGASVDYDGSWYHSVQRSSFARRARGGNLPQFSSPHRQRKSPVNA
ncbi:hypothetical protein EDB83DRAFT_272051 [Lactarius deliciosus]|nr:hypothetical protein EDB83DRAFT_272051 [Lactarius deliciosus]